MIRLPPLLHVHGDGKPPILASPALLNRRSDRTAVPQTSPPEWARFHASVTVGNANGQRNADAHADTDPKSKGPHCDAHGGTDTHTHTHPETEVLSNRGSSVF